MPLPEVAQANLAQGSAPLFNPNLLLFVLLLNYFAFNMHHKGAETLTYFASPLALHYIRV